MKPENAKQYVEDRDGEVFLLDYLIVIMKRKWLIFCMAFFAAIIGGVYVYLQPNIYTATVRVLIPVKSDSGLSGIIANAAGDFAGAILGGSSAADVYKGILESRTVTDRLIDRFSLKERYGEQYMESTRQKLLKNTKIEGGEGQIISISVKDEEAQTAADIANAYTNELDRINRNVNITEGHLKRVFLEKRLEKVKDELLEVEGRLKGFQEKYGLVALEEQAKATIEGAAKIKGEIVLAQTELEVFKKFGTVRNKEAVRLESKISELTNQLVQIEAGTNGGELIRRTGSEGKMEANFYIPFNELPSLGLQLARLTREAKIQEEVFKLVTSQYELAKIEEARDINTIQILDSAVPPDKKSGPQRVLIALLAATAGLFIGIVAAFFREFMANLKDADPDRYKLFVRYSPVHRSKV
ncbi:MAG: hypothetical protein C4530_23580 [Desulfobacteraceae bacterium]|nr:MAG: hypothetical protein C4530_23580 [Desulfobacteraceae bacterium]